jgi:hypothetical protein
MMPRGHGGGEHNTESNVLRTGKPSRGAIYRHYRSRREGRELALVFVKEGRKRARRGAQAGHLKCRQSCVRYGVGEDGIEEFEPKRDQIV